MKIKKQEENLYIFLSSPRSKLCIMRRIPTFGNPEKGHFIGGTCTLNKVICYGEDLDF